MAVKNPRINITLEKDTTDFLIAIANLKNKSVAGLARELILEAIEMREDIALSEIANERDTDDAKRVKYHKDVWK